MNSSISNMDDCLTPDVDESESSPALEKVSASVSKRKRTSNVWVDFTLINVNGKEYAKCKYCEKQLTGNSSYGSSHLRRHRNSCLKKQISKGKRTTLSFGANLNKPISKWKQTTLSFGANSSVTVPKFEMKNIRKLMAQCIIMHGLPFSLVNDKYYNKLLQALNSKFVPFSRETLTREVVSMYKTEKLQVQGIINDVQRVSLTFHMWTSQQTLGYLCMAGEYIDKDWKLHSHIFSFVPVHSPHDDATLAEILSDCVSKWEIQSKLFSITTDNCSTNDSLIASLLKNMGRRNIIPIKGKYFHIHCAAHIINLMVQDGLTDSGDIVTKIRDSVKYVKGSVKRVKSFEECMKTMGLDDKKVLSYDIPTRWNSTYIMLRDALLYKDVFQHLASVDSRYVFLPSDDEWSRASILCQFLKVFYNITNVFSAMGQVTANQVFEQILDIYKHLYKHHTSVNEHIKQLVCKMQEKFDQYFKEYNLLFAFALVLDPRFKLAYLKYLLDGFNDFDGPVEYEKINCSIREMYDEYANIYKDVAVDNERQNIATDLVEDEDDIGYSRPQVPHTDLEVYLNDPLEEVSSSEEFNILSWWKSNENKYKIVSKMARDILAIPASTVASESAFNIADRILNDYKCSTSPENIEAVVCTQSWIPDATNSCDIISDEEEC